MNTLMADLRRLFARWRGEDAAVADAVFAVNLARARVLCPAIAVLNAVYALAFLVQWLGGAAAEVARPWALGLFWLHGGMGLLMLACAIVAYQYRYASRTPLVGGLPPLLIGTGILFSVVVVAAAQRVAPGIALYLISCLVAGVLVYLRPVLSVWVYLVSYAAFFYGMGVAQTNAAQLLSHRRHGAAAAVLGWGVSVVLWRKFATITVQQEQLAKAHAELQQKQRELERLTRLDGLTGLFNRNTFVELCKQELLRAQRQGSATAILLLDLDHFKRINDTWGHPAGDAVLRHVAAVAAGTVRSTDLVGRLGGEEFIVLLPGTSLEAARKLAEKLRLRLQASVAPWQPTPIPVTASMGISATTATEKRDFDTLYNAADKALYLAKTRGRNRVEH